VVNANPRSGSDGVKRTFLEIALRVGCLKLELLAAPRQVGKSQRHR